jgi:uncharacterized protein (DUF488 family)
MLFERQKTLLAFVDELGGRVASTDLQKLLFLWSQELRETDRLYDFVPHHFGAFSFTSYADRRKLVEKGYLADEEKHWAITTAGRLAMTKQGAVRTRVAAYLANAPSLRGEALIALTYRRHPFYAVRSDIAERILSDDTRALEQVRAARPPLGPPGIATIGYEGRSLESYLVALMRNGVSVLCDVRKNPVSRRYGFAKSTLARGCESVGIRYEHLPELGIASSERKGLETQADYDALFAAYERDSLPAHTEALGRIVAWVAAGERVALTCFEHLPRQCHRHCVARALERDHGAPFTPFHL